MGELNLGCLKSFTPDLSTLNYAYTNRLTSSMQGPFGDPAEVGECCKT